MARLNVNPTRMELNNLKKRLSTAKNGHKLLKDKQDELVRRFIDLIKENESLRKQVEKKLSIAFRNFALASCVYPQEFLQEALLISKEEIMLEIEEHNVMSVNVPKMTFKRKLADESGSIFPYGFSNTSFELDESLEKLYDILPQLLRLGEVEKTTNLMADEIQKTRRRVNALEYRTIPQLEETIKYIIMKLDENDRQSLIRLIKVKDLIENGR